MNAANLASAALAAGARSSSRWVMPVSSWMNGDMRLRGLTSVWNVSSVLFSRNLTAPISMMASLSSRPVVSRSKDTQMLSASGG